MLKHEPLSPVLGASISDLDLSQVDLSSVAAELRRLLCEHLVLLIRGQVLSMDQQIALTTSFGDIEPVWDAPDRHPDNPQIHVVSNALRREKNYRSSSQVWHTDRSFMPHPSVVTILYSVQAPPSGGATSYANMRAAYAELPADIKERTEQARAVHAFSYMMSELMASKYSPERAREEAERYPPVEHHVVRHQPLTGEKALYLNQLCVSHIVGLDPEESRELLDTLYAHALQEKFMYPHEWKTGDVLIWDNSSLMHKGNPSDPQYPRVMYRTTTSNLHPL